MPIHKYNTYTTGRLYLIPSHTPHYAEVHLMTNETFHGCAESADNISAHIL